VSDEEVIAAFMEPVPGFREIDYPKSIAGWWTAPTGHTKVPAVLDLDALHEVEARLTEERWDLYISEFWKLSIGSTWARDYLHASAADKIKALATVLRPIVEAAQKEKVSA